VADKTERELSAEDVLEIAGRLKVFLEPFQKLLTREEQRAHAEGGIPRSASLMRSACRWMSSWDEPGPPVHWKSTGRERKCGAWPSLSSASTPR